MAFPATAPSQSKARLSILKRALTCSRFSRSRPHRRKVGYLVSSGILGLSAVCPAAAPSQNVRQRCLSLLHRRCPRPARPRLHRATSSWVRSSISLHSSSALSSAWPAAALSQEFERGPRVTVWEGQSAARPAAAPSQAGEPGPATGRGLLPAACPGAAPSQVRALPTLKNKRTFVRITQAPFQQLEGGLKADDHDRSAARRAPNRPARYAVWRSPANRA